MASLQTPERIRTLQRKLYLKAKAEPAFRFYLLYDKIHRADILSHAYALARSNGGAPGVDGDGAEPTRSRKCTGTSAGATPTWSMLICRNTSTRSRTRS